MRLHRAVAAVAAGTLAVSGLGIVSASAAPIELDLDPVRTIAGDATGIGEPDIATTDADGYVYVGQMSDTDGPSIRVFEPGADGDLAPVRVIQGDNTQLFRPEDIAINAAGEIVVAEVGYDNVVVFAPDADGDVAPIRVIDGPATGFDAEQLRGMALGPDGNIFTVASNGRIAEFAADADGDVAPLRTIQGPQTGLDGSGGLEGVQVADDGTIHVLQYFPALVAVFAADASGDVAPIRSFAPPSDLVIDPMYLELDDDGNTYVVAGNVHEMTLTVFGPDAEGAAEPLNVVEFGTDLGYSMGLHLADNGDLYVADRADDAVLVYAPFQVGPAPTTTTLSGPTSVTEGTTVELDVTVANDVDAAAVPTGTVDVTAGDVTVEVTLTDAAGAAELDLPVGTHEVTASYGGDELHLGSSDTLTVVVEALAGPDPDENGDETPGPDAGDTGDEGTDDEDPNGTDGTGGDDDEAGAQTGGPSGSLADTGTDSRSLLATAALLLLLGAALAALAGATRTRRSVC